MTIADESRMTLNGVTYSLLKAKAGGVEGAVLIAEEPGKAEDRVFFPLEALKALVMLAKPGLSKTA